MKKIVCLLIVLTVTAGLLNAFDGKRKGFILGWGLGMGKLDITEKYNEVKTDGNMKDYNFATNSKIGWGFNENLEVYYTAKNFWGTHKNREDKKETFATGVSAIGVSYFFNKKAETTWKPSLFVSGGAGIAGWQNPFEDKDEEETMAGFGFFGGFGYEFFKHYSIEADFIMGNPHKGSHKIDMNGFSITINALAF